MKKRFVPYWLRQRYALKIAIYRLRQLFYKKLPKAIEEFGILFIDTARKVNKVMEKAFEER